MRSVPSFLLLLSAGFLLAGPAIAAGDEPVTVYSENFETGAPLWGLAATSAGKSQILPDGAAPTDGHHLALFGMGPDQRTSASATVQRNFSNGQRAVLKFRARNPNAERLQPGVRQVSFSTDGYVWTTALDFTAAGSPALTNEWQTFSISLDEVMKSTGMRVYSPWLQIRFYNAGVGEPGKDGLEIDDVQLIDKAVVPKVTLSLPETEFYEEAGAVLGQISVYPPLQENLKVKLVATPAGNVLDLPQEVELTAGSTSTLFYYGPHQDDVVNGTRTVQVQATADGLPPSDVTTVTVRDDDGMNARLFLPSALAEGDNRMVMKGWINLTQPAPQNLTFKLTSSPAGQMSAPASVTVKKGETQVYFTVRATDDAKRDGDVLATLTATGTGAAAGIPQATAKTLCLDNEKDPLALTLTLPQTVLEGGIAQGTVTLNQRVNRDVKITVSSSAGLTPTSPYFTVQANQLSTMVSFIAVDNAVQDGSRIEKVKVASGTVSASGIIAVRDNEVARYAIEKLDDIVDMTNPVPVAFSVYDVEGNTITRPPDELTFRLLFPDGSVQKLPASGFQSPQSGYTYSGLLTFPPTTAAPLRLEISDTTGGEIVSPPFDGLRRMPLKALAKVWDEAHGRLYVSVAADDQGAYAGQIVAIDPRTLTVTASVAPGGAAQLLALTSDGEYLYAALNGNRQIARLRTAALGVEAKFPIGEQGAFDPAAPTITDLKTVAGQPDVLVAARAGASNNAQDVVVFDHGQARPVVAADPFLPSNRLEASGDPSIFYGLDTRSSDLRVHRLKVDAQGVTVVPGPTNYLGVSGRLLSGGGGDLLVSSDGSLTDGVHLRSAGDLDTRGAVLTVPDQKRAYFLEPQTKQYGAFSVSHFAAYDLRTGTRVKQLKLPVAALPSEYQTADLIRGGGNTLIYQTSYELVVLGAGQFMPSGGNVDLAVTAETQQSQPVPGQTVTYSVRVTNQGPGIATDVILTTNLTGEQTVASARLAGSPDPAKIAGAKISAPVGTLAAGQGATLLIEVSPSTAGHIGCLAAVSSVTADANAANDTASCDLAVTYAAGTNQTQRIRMDIENLVYDASRNRLMAAVRDHDHPDVVNSLVAIDPLTGLVSAPMAIPEVQQSAVMTLSPNGRYLYAGVERVNVVQRFDLSATPPTLTEITLPDAPPEYPNQAWDIAVLDGDGTSFVVCGPPGRLMLFEDGTVRATSEPGYSSLERTGTPGVFVAYKDGRLARVKVSAQGFEQLDTPGKEAGGWGYVTDGDLLVDGQGQIIDLKQMVTKGETRFTGRPLVDEKRHKAYQVTDTMIRAFDASSGATQGSYTFKSVDNLQRTTEAIRWGTDGFAFVVEDGYLYITRWDAEQNAAGSSPEADQKLADFFGLNLQVGDSLSSAVQCRTEKAADGSGQLVFSFPRRVGPIRPYHYETSSDLIHWDVSTPQSQKELPSETTAQGIAIQRVESIHPVSSTTTQPVFLRLVLED